MSLRQQEGIYYKSKPQIGNSFCILSLKAESNSDIREVGIEIKEIWNHLNHLKQGITVDLKVDLKHRKIGNLTTLIAYGPKLFELPECRVKRPSRFLDSWNFKNPIPKGGGLIVEGSGISYSNQIQDNHLLNDHVIFQFIADTEFYTSRACVEVCKVLLKLERQNGNSHLRITGLYPGFQRADQRNWFGFHDGVSNIKPRDRPYVIFVDSRSTSLDERWTVNGTYLGFMRIVLDLERWENIPIALQEVAIGRDKLTGCPLVGVDKNLQPIKDKRCPVSGTSEVIDSGNEYFRDHPSYGSRFENRILQLSHIGATAPSDRVPIWDKKSLRIFRQGFEYLTYSKATSRVAPGLNFVSFQNSPERLIRALTYRHMIAQRLPQQTLIPDLEQFMSILAAGLFFVPPIHKDEPFPGTKIFYDLIKSRQYK